MFAPSVFRHTLRVAKPVRNLKTPIKETQMKKLFTLILAGTFLVATSMAQIVDKTQSMTKSVAHEADKTGHKVAHEGEKTTKKVYHSGENATKKTYHSGEKYTKKSYHKGKKYSKKGYKKGKHYTKKGYHKTKHAVTDDHTRHP
jgi:Ni/Co efflux regulator RcnB